MAQDSPLEHFDVIIIGAGLSGVGAARHLQEKCPGKRYVILEGRAAKGGTWDLFRYPGIRSDSDMHTLGYNFKPWKSPKTLADGPSIRNYIEETAAENNIEQHIRYKKMVKSANWNSAEACWHVQVEDREAGTSASVSCNFLLFCGGYYNYESGYSPSFPGQETFTGSIVHPQSWPKDLDYSGKKVVIIGSGATAVTLLPAMADQAASVTMLQRSPTYIASWTSRDRIAALLRKFLPEQTAYDIVRWKNTTIQQVFYHLTRTRPEWVKKALLNRVRRELGPDYDVDKHFTPSYNPWDQRVCLVPDSDLFHAVREGRAQVVTDQIEHFTASGIKLASGDELQADIIISATGLNLQMLGGVDFKVDDQAIDFAEQWTYKGLMISGVPNMVQTFGYINASWTLRADLTAEYLCRLLNHMDASGTQQVVPTLRASDADMPARRWIEDFDSGYMQRGLHAFPKQGDRVPWLNPQDYARDKSMFRKGTLEDGVLAFSTPSS